MAKAAGNSDSLDLRPARLPSTLPKDDKGPLKGLEKAQDGFAEDGAGGKIPAERVKDLLSRQEIKRRRDAKGLEKARKGNPWERGRPARMLPRWPPLSFPAMLQTAILSGGTV